MVSPTSSHAASPMSAAARLHANPLPPVMRATADASEHADQMDILAKARAFAESLMAGETLDTGENILAHADAVTEILAGIGGSVAMQAASYLVYACPHLNKPEEVMAKAFGPQLAQLAMQTNQLVHVQRLSRAAESSTLGPDNTPLSPRVQTENVRRCCWLSAAICGWSCCAWPRVCKPCAITLPPSCQSPPLWPASRCRCSRL